MNQLIIDGVLWDISCKILHASRTNKEGTLDSHILAILEEAGLKEVVRVLEFYQDTDSRMKVNGKSLIDIDRGKRAASALSRLKGENEIHGQRKAFENEIQDILEWVAGCTKEFDMNSSGGRERAVRMAHKGMKLIEEIQQNG